MPCSFNKTDSITGFFPVILEKIVGIVIMYSACQQLILAISFLQFHSKVNLVLFFLTCLSIFYRRKLAQKTAFITGASRGIGKAIALKLAKDGCNIVIAAKTANPHPKLPGTIYTAAKESKPTHFLYKFFKFMIFSNLRVQLVAIKCFYKSCRLVDN